jgi:predicted CXXCH cytochrome family protein
MRALVFKHLRLFYPRIRQVGLSIATALGALLVACATTMNRTILAPPQIPGAQYAGTAACADCHDDYVREFKGATHSGLKHPEGMQIGCESCHGPGSLHVESGGAFHTIINPGRSPESCFPCHLDKRGEFNLPHAHPVLAGKMSCSDCHNPHQGAAGLSATALLGHNDTCLQCHTAQRGPFVFEHEATHEGCTTCHNPHGSVNNKMLTARNANLCLKCHFQEHRPGGEILIGGQAHAGRLRTGTCWTAGCHEAVHGSHVNTSLRF